MNADGSAKASRGVVGADIVLKLNSCSCHKLMNRLLQSNCLTLVQTRFPINIFLLELNVTFDRSNIMELDLLLILQ
jgi:hypothetical protein